MKHWKIYLFIIFSFTLLGNSHAKSETAKIDVVICGVGDLYTLAEVEDLKNNPSYTSYWKDYCDTGNRHYFDRFKNNKVSFKMENLCAEITEEPKSSRDVFLRYQSTVTCNERSKLPGYAKNSKNIRLIKVKNFLVHEFEILDVTLTQKLGLEKKYIAKKSVKNTEPSQTQPKKVKKKIELQLYFCEGAFFKAYLKKYNDGKCEDGKEIDYQKFKEKKLTKVATGGRFELFYIRHVKLSQKIAILTSCEPYSNNSGNEN